MHLYLALLFHRDYFGHPDASLSDSFAPQGLLYPGRMHLYLVLLFHRDYFDHPDASLACSFVPQGLFRLAECISVWLFCAAGIISTARMHPITGRPSLKTSLPGHSVNFRFMEETMKNKNQLIGCCGLDCEKCDARIATIANDNTLREKTAALWTKLNGVTILPETINCTGCRIEGAKTPFCDKLCPVHNCVREKGLDTCADCAQMDACPMLGQIAVNSPFVLENLKQLKQDNA